MNFIKSALQNPILFPLLKLLFHQIIIYVLENSINALYKGRALTFDAFRNGIFPIRETKDKGLKTLAPKQMLQK